MTWLFRTLVGAVVAGLGWKLGVDTYETIKEHVKKHSEKVDENGMDNGAGAAQTGSVDRSDSSRRERE